MTRSTAGAGHGPDLQELEQELDRLAVLWHAGPEVELPPGLAERAVGRVRREALLGGRVVKVEWRVRLGSVAGLAASLLLGLGLTLWQGSRLPLLEGGADWAAGLELPERFESPVHETEVRLERIGALLEEPETTAPGGEVDELRRRLDRLAEEMEVF